MDESGFADAFFPQMRADPLELGDHVDTLLRMQIDDVSIPCSREPAS